MPQLTGTSRLALGYVVTEVVAPPPSKGSAQPWGLYNPLLLLQLSSAHASNKQNRPSKQNRHTHQAEAGGTTAASNKSARYSANVLHAKKDGLANEPTRLCTACYSADQQPSGQPHGIFKNRHIVTCACACVLQVLTPPGYLPLLAVTRRYFQVTRYGFFPEG